MSKVRLSNRSKKVLLVLLYCLLPLFFTLILFCKDNYEIAHGRPGSVIAPTDLDTYWYVIEKGSDSIGLVGLTVEDVEQYEYKRMMISEKNEFILEYDGRSSINQTLDIELPYKLHVVHCEMHDEDDPNAGLDVSIDSYIDSQGKKHQYERILQSVESYGNLDMEQMCYDKYINSKYGESSVPFFKYFRYMPAIHEDPYIEHYRLWSEVWPYARVILIFSLFFLLFALLDKPRSFTMMNIMGLFSILYCLLCLGTLTGFLQLIWPFSH